MTSNRPFSGVTVLDFSRVLAGPFCTALLADMGADIIKVEPPSGDDQRAMGAFKNGISISFELTNRNKRSIRLDLKDPEGLDIARALAARCDVVVENFRPGVARKLGIDYTTLSKGRKDLVYCSISGFGQAGPLASSPSYDVIAQALSGLMSITGAPDAEPMMVGDSVGDTVSGLFAAWVGQSPGASAMRGCVAMRCWNSPACRSGRARRGSGPDLCPAPNSVMRSGARRMMRMGRSSDVVTEIQTAAAAMDGLA